MTKMEIGYKLAKQFTEIENKLMETRQSYKEKKEGMDREEKSFHRGVIRSIQSDMDTVLNSVQLLEVDKQFQNGIEKVYLENSKK